ncbi:MAG: thiamine pyrophosphate-dependent dehydrogenase E1 component subunit alpha [Symbiobacteriia bacterium]
MTAAKTRPKRPRHRALGLSDETVKEMYYYILLGRALDERTWLLNRAGKIPFVISGQGQEAAQVGSAFALDKTRDVILPYYRDLAVVVAWGMTPTEAMLGSFAKAGDPSSNGRQMPGHWGSKRLRIVSGSSPVATQVPHAVGFALAAKMRGDKSVVWVSLGEGSTNQGDFHEAMNFAGVHQLPVIVFVENNKYAISVPQAKELAGHVADRAKSYNMPGVRVDGNDFLAVWEAVHTAAERARSGGWPTLIEAETYRLVPHSSDDDDRGYRSREEVAEARKHDPVLVAAKYVHEAGLITEEEDKALRERIRREVDEATDAAEKAAYAAPEAALGHVYANDVAGANHADDAGGGR